MNEEDIIRRAKTAIRRFDSLRIVGAGWAGNSRQGFQFNPESGLGGAAGGIIPPVTSSGACCPEEGDCFIATQSVCEGGGGTYQGDNTPCDPDPCANVTCCSGGVLIIPLLNLNYQVSVSGTAVPDSCLDVYTLAGSSSSLNQSLLDIPCVGDSWNLEILNTSWTFNTDPSGLEEQNCFALFNIFLGCDVGPGWTIEITVPGNSGNCGGLCPPGGFGIITWGGGDTGVMNLGADPRGVFSINISDLSVPTLTWHFDITIT